MAILIEVRGGCVQAVYSTLETNVFLRDFDEREDSTFPLQDFPVDAITDEQAQEINLFMQNS